jgi:pimeloyl-ACP methyl ester carboxylesterase
MSDKTNQTLTVDDGGRLGFAEYGAADGKPVFFFPGFPGSRLSAALGDDAAKRAGVRVIAVDRPGSGLSDYQRGRRILDWPADVALLADDLGLTNFAVAGVSGGGPYAAVCAYKMPERVTSCGLISGVGEIKGHESTRGMNRINRLIFGIGRWAPFLAYPPLAFMRRMATKNPEAALKQAAGSMAEADRRVLERPEVRELFKADMAEAMRQGTRGAVQDTALYSRPWGFAIEEIRVPVHIWQGDADRNVPAEHARLMAERIPGATLHMFAGEGHLLVVDRMEEILQTLVGVEAGSKV